MLNNIKKLWNYIHEPTFRAGLYTGRAIFSVTPVTSKIQMAEHVGLLQGDWGLANSIACYKLLIGCY